MAVPDSEIEGGWIEMNDQVKHLELIQAVINRLAQNSFSYKGWAITLVAALFALGAKESSPQYLLVALLPTIVFWGLDAYYLRQERLFRKFYDSVRVMPHEGWTRNPFSMDTSPYNDQVATWWKVCWSNTIGWLYGPMVLVISIVTSLAFAWR